MSLDVYLECHKCNPCADHGAHELWSANITHNLGPMAEAAGIYSELWRPEEIGIDKAAQLVLPLRAGLTRLVAEPSRYRAHNPPNGWGDYEGMVRFVRDYIEACGEHPDARVRVSR